MTWMVSAAVLGLAGTTAFFLHRARSARREQSLRLHEAALGLDRRCDVLQEQIRTLDRRQRIDHLFDLVAQVEAEGHVDPDRAHRLRRFALDLRAESFVSRP